jgi:hypothetical protein
MRLKCGSTGHLSTSGNLTIVSDWYFYFPASNGSSQLTDTVQRGFSIDPDQLSPSSGMEPTNSCICFRGVYSRFDIGQSVESAMLIASLRDVIRQQSAEIEALQTQLKETKATSNESDSQV